MIYALYAVLSVLVLVGLSLQSKVKTAVLGNLLSLGAMAAAVLFTIFYNGAGANVLLWIFLAAGLGFGLFWAYKVKMVEMPQTVGMLNGIGGLASAMVGAFELFAPGKNAFVYITAGLALMIGAITFTGSLIAALKLSGKMNSRPVVLKGHSTIAAVLLGLAVCGLILGAVPGLRIVGGIINVLASLSFGCIFAIRVGGADMPISISLLNSLSGVAGAIAGMAIYNLLLVAVGGIVGSSGILLTQIMCKAMNRRLGDILLGKTVKRQEASADKAKSQEKAPAEEDKAELEAAHLPRAEEEANEAPLAEGPNPDENRTLNGLKDIIFVPGYGMALSQAQEKVKELSDKLVRQGARVRYAIHPVAGRMPGHMNVLLAEVDVDYDLLMELDDINPEFKNCDAVVVVGASDVLNPAAREAEGTPIYGMPILNVDEAPMVFICNFNLEPGYAGVPNPLYERRSGIRILLGDAKDSLQVLIDELDA